MVKNKDMQFFMENLKMKRKKDKKILTFRNGDLNPGFSVIFPPIIFLHYFFLQYNRSFYGEFENKQDKTKIRPSGVGIRTPDFQ